MKCTVSTFHTDNLLLFSPGTEDFCAVDIKVILVHGHPLFLATQFLE